jgi:peptidoglycan/LPS O-acetylase OafA/YrhL
MEDQDAKPERFPALDGLRGFSAVSVLLVHLNWDLFSITTSPIALHLYHIVMSTMGVQYFFVLCGFLMSYLYPAVTSPARFYARRYLRIFPVYIVVVAAIWIGGDAPWWVRLGILVSMAITGGILWRILLSGMVRLRYTRIFTGFVALQVVCLLLFGILARVNGWHWLATTSASVALTNITLTFPFSTDTILLSRVFWSIPVEVYFYLLYPLVVIPMITLTRHSLISTSIAVIMSLCVLALVDFLFRSDSGLSTLRIIQASGLVTGIIAGTIVRRGGVYWDLLKKLLGRAEVSALCLVLFCFIQWADWTLHRHDPIGNVVFYIMASFGIAIVVLSAVVKGTWLNNVFSLHALRFLGGISFSIYLIHDPIITVLRDTTVPQLNLGPAGSAIVLMLSTFAVVIPMALFLYHAVEKLYFRSSQKELRIIK